MARQDCAISHEFRTISRGLLRVRSSAAELAASDGVSLNQFIAAAVAEKVGSLRAADNFLRERAGSTKPKDMLKYLRRAPKVAPNTDDMP
jgi:hypothetical protein